MYRLQVTKTEDNVNYEKELAECKKNDRRNSYNYGNEPQNRPEREFVREVLYVMLTDEQFDAVKKAVLAEFK